MFHRPHYLLVLSTLAVSAIPRGDVWSSNKDPMYEYPRSTGEDPTQGQEPWDFASAELLTQIGHHNIRARYLGEILDSFGKHDLENDRLLTRNETHVEEAEAKMKVAQNNNLETRKGGRKFGGRWGGRYRGRPLIIPVPVAVPVMVG